MSAELVPLAELGEWDRLAWRELADRAAEPNPFFDPDFVLPAARALGEEDEVALVVRRDSEGWSACLPVRHYRRWHRLPLPCLATWRHKYCMLGTPLVATGAETEAIADLVAAMRGAGGISFAALDWVSAEGSLAELLAEAAGPRAIAFERFQRAALFPRPGGEYLDDWLKGKERREFRRRSRKLGEELGGEPGAVNRSREPRALDTFLELEASGWKGEEGTALASDPAHARFLREVAAAFAARGALNLVFLEAGETPVAATCNLLAGGVDFCFKVGYDERYARFGPGRELQMRMIDSFHAEPSVRMMDSCTDPNNELYNRLWRDRRQLQTTTIAAPGVRGAVAGPALRAAMAYRDRRRAADVD